MTIDGEAELSKAANGQHGEGAHGERYDSRWAMRDGGMSLYIFFISERMKVDGRGPVRRPGKKCPGQEASDGTSSP